MSKESRLTVPTGSPGDVARAVFRRLRASTRLEIPLEGLRPAAVALPLVPTGDGTAILLTVRTAQLAQHKGEISFPGGRIDPGDVGTLEAALRETWEEVGILPQDVTVLGSLDDFVSVTGYRVTPHVVSLAASDYPFRPQPREVAEILLVPLSHLLDRSNYSMEARSGRNGRVHCFRWGHYLIWGLTAAILKRLLEIAFDFGEGT